MRAAPFALAMLVMTAPVAAAEPLLLAPGKSVTIVHAADPSMRVVIAAPANEPLDLAALLAGADAKEGVPSLVTRSQVRSAGAIVQNADGSFSLGAPARAAASSAKTIEGGAIFVAEGGYAWQADLPSVSLTAPAAAQQMIQEKQDRSAKPPMQLPIPKGR